MKRAYALRHLRHRKPPLAAVELASCERLRLPQGGRATRDRYWGKGHKDEAPSPRWRDDGCFPALSRVAGVHERCART